MIRGARTKGVGRCEPQTRGGREGGGGGPGGGPGDRGPAGRALTGGGGGGLGSGRAEPSGAASRAMASGE